MIITPHLDARLDTLPDYPFARLAKLLGAPPNAESIVMSIGEPQHTPPAMVAQILSANASLWGKYPPANGSAELRQAVADWAKRRYQLPDGLINPETAILPVAGTREALYLIAQTVCGDRGGQRPLVLLPNPFYQVYAGAAVMAGAEPVFVPGVSGPASQPDFSALPAEALDRTALAYLCTPANPQGMVADSALLERQVCIARKHGFVLASDECYSEIWDKAPPPGVLAACAALGEGLSNVLMFNSLSKRSSVPGLRSGVVVGDEAVIRAFSRLRSYGGAATPLPIAAAAAALWRDESHVMESAELYRAKLDMAEKILGGRFGFYRPAGGFFLWLNVGDGEQAAIKLWREANIRVLPGAYLAAEDSEEGNPGQKYIRVALVHDLATTETALKRMVAVLGS